MGLRCSTFVRNIQKHHRVGVRNNHGGLVKNTEKPSTSADNQMPETLNFEQNTNDASTRTNQQNDTLEPPMEVDRQLFNLDHPVLNHEETPTIYDTIGYQGQPIMENTQYQAHLCIWEATTIETTGQYQQEISWLQIESTQQKFITNLQSPEMENTNQQFNFILPNEMQTSFPSIQEIVPQWEFCPPLELQEEQPLAASLQHMERELLANYHKFENPTGEAPSTSCVLEPQSVSMFASLGEPYDSIYSRQTDDIVAQNIQEMDRKFYLDKYNMNPATSIYDNPQPSTSTYPEYTGEKNSEHDLSNYFDCFHLNKQQCMDNFNDDGPPTQNYQPSNSKASQIPEMPEFDSISVIEQTINEVLSPRQEKIDIGTFSMKSPKRTKKKPKALMCPLLFQCYFNVKAPDVDEADISFTDVSRGLQPVLSDNFPSAIAITNKLMIIGKGPHNHVDLDSFGHCDFVSALHAMVFYDEFSNKFKLFNRSPYGTQINDVVYGNEQEKEETLQDNEHINRRGCLCLQKEVANSPEQTIVLKHGATISFGCITFVFSVLKNIV